MSLLPFVLRPLILSYIKILPRVIQRCKTTTASNSSQNAGTEEEKLWLY
jgi:hypothetical protein